MTRSEEIRRDEAIASRSRPAIVAALRRGEEPLSISRAIARDFNVDETRAYRWVAYLAEDFERRRRRIAAVGLVLLWPGLLFAVVAPILWFFGVRQATVPLWLLGVTIGLPVAAAGAGLAAGSRRLARPSL